MGLLDDLKKQAEQVKTQQLSKDQLRQHGVKEIDDKAKQLFQYVSELLKQLVVVKPINPLVFVIPGVGELKELKFTDSFIDYRKKRLNDQDCFESIRFYIKWTSPNNLVIERDMPQVAQKVRDALTMVGVKFEEEEVRNAKGAVANTKFTVPAAIVADFKVTVEHEQGKFVIRTRNVLRLGNDDLVIPVTEVTEPLLEEFAKIMLGQQTTINRYRVLNLPPR